MNIKLSISLIIIILLVSCGLGKNITQESSVAPVKTVIETDTYQAPSVNTTESEQPTQKPSPTQRPFATITSKSDEVPTAVLPTIALSPTPLPESPLPEYITPSLTQICPDNRNVSIEELGLDPDLRLLLTTGDEIYPDLPQSGVYALSSTIPIPRLISNTNSTDGWENKYLGLSMDNHWLILYRTFGDDPQYTISISSVDGNNQWILGEYPLGTSIWWVDDQDAAIVGLPEDYDAGPFLKGRMPISKLNPFSGKSSPLTALPGPSRFETFFRENDTDYSLYSVGGDFFYDQLAVFNYIEGQSESAFKWLTGNKSINLFNTKIQLIYNPEKKALFSVMVYRPYGWDIAVDLPLDAIRESVSYQDVMKSIIFPWNDSDTIGWQISLGTFSVERIDKKNIEDRSFYILDYKNMILKDYCFDQVTASTRFSFSPDGNFVAINLYDERIDKSPISAKEVAILNLGNGKIAHIPSFQAIGWGIDDNGNSP